MSAIRKVGVEFYPSLSVGAVMTGLASTLSAKYKLRDEATYTNHNVAFTEDIAGTYSVPITLTVSGDYQFVIESTDVGIENLSGSILVTNAGIDDVKNAIDAAQLDITAIKTQVDLLDEASINELTVAVAGVQTTVTNLQLMIDDANGDTTGLNSVLDYVTEINLALDSGSSSLSVLAGYTDNLELMLEGKPYTNTDGVAITVENSKGLVDIYSLIESVGGDTSVLSTILSDMNTSITNTINSAHDDTVARLNSLSTIVTANKGYLENTGYGLSALSIAISDLQTTVDSHDTDKTDILAVLNNATTGLAAIKTAILDKLEAMDVKLDSIMVSSRSKIML